MSRIIAKNLIKNKKIGEKANSFCVSMKTRIVIFSVIFVLLCISYLLVGFDRVQAGTRKILARIGVYTEEIKSVEEESSNYGVPGSWHVEKSAEWIGPNQAQVTFKVDSVIKTNNNYKDIILVLDVSGSMAGSKMDKALTDSKNLVEYLLEDENNHVSIITFSNDSTILTPFSNDKDLVLSKLDIVATEDSTNYNAALLNVDEVMSDYVKQSDHDVVTLFLTDGYPNKDTPNQIGTYTILKDKYPYMDINGIQYEMGNTIISDLKKMTDSQWATDQKNLHNILLEAAFSPMRYERFILTDYIDDRYFNVDSVHDIEVSAGNVSFTNNNRITWNLSHKYVMGEDITMTIKMFLKPTYAREEGFYPTNIRTEIISKEEGELEKTSMINETPVLKNLYDVIYDTNTPDGCFLEDIPTEQYFVYQRVNQKSNELSCEGYLFKGWKVEEEASLERINDDMFYMPGQDIHIRAIWSRQSIVKTMNGNVHEKTTLYKAFEATADKQYTGLHNDSMDPSKSTENIYYYWLPGQSENNAILEKNNVIFANHCWQMIRTTDTGGVKLVYNGEVENNQCLDNRSNHVGYNATTSMNLSGNYWYGTDYTYDKNTNTFRIDGEVEQKEWNEMNGPSLIGKYTCKLTLQDGTCSTIYYIGEYVNTTNARVFNIDSNSHYSQFGALPFNSFYNSYAAVGYMYGEPIPLNSKPFPYYEGLANYWETIKTNSFDNSIWFSDTVDWNETILRSYSLIDPYQASEVANYSDLVGKYTFISSNLDYHNYVIYYVVAVNDGKLYCRSLANGETPAKYEPLLFGDSIMDNGDGTYTLQNVESVSLLDWYSHGSDYVGMYTCNSNIETSCQQPRYGVYFDSSRRFYYIDASQKILIAKKRNGSILEDTITVRYDEFFANKNIYNDYRYTCNSTSNICTEESLRIIDYRSTNDQSHKGYFFGANHYYGSSVIWDGEKYKLVDTIELESFDDLEELSTHHYVCLDPGRKECTEVAFICFYRATVPDSLQFVLLKDGVTSSDELLDRMLKHNINSSIIKNGVEAWYQKNLLPYDSYIEDTVFCNDRTIDDLKSWNSNGGKTSDLPFFNAGWNTNDLYCTNETDRFSISNDQARTRYKVGLLSYAEMGLVSHQYSRRTGSSFSLASPYVYQWGGLRNRIVDMNGQNSTGGTTESLGVRPSISLVPGIEYIDGDGSRERPYYIDTEYS